MTQQLSKDANDVIVVARELQAIDDAGVRMLQQLFAFRVNQDLVGQLVVGREQQIALSLFKVTINMHADATLGYVLRFLADLCLLCPSLVGEFSEVNAARIFGADPVATFADIADTKRDVPGVFNPAIYLLGATLCRTPFGTRKNLVAKFLGTVQRSCSAAELNVEKVEYVVHSACEFIRCTENRQAFREAGIVKDLPRMLSQAIALDSSSSVQLTYELLLAIRLISFDYESLIELHKCNTIAVIHRVLQKIHKEKCIRMALFVLKSFAKAQETFLTAKKGHEFVGTAVLILGKCNKQKGPNFYADMISVGTLKTLQSLRRKTYGDEDVAAAIEELTAALDSNLDALTSFGEYYGELQSGVLEWSPVHSSARFWKENCRKFEADDYRVFVELAGLLQTGGSDLTVAVACHDIGELVRHHPSGRGLLTVPALNGVKERIMGLMSSSNPDVAKQALTAVQKILVDHF